MIDGLEKVSLSEVIAVVSLSLPADKKRVFDPPGQEVVQMRLQAVQDFAD